MLQDLLYRARFGHSALAQDHHELGDAAHQGEVVDPHARHTRKSGEARRDGYRAHLAACPETGIITDEKLTRASGEENSDLAVAEEFLAAEAAGSGASLGGPGSPSPAGRGPPGCRW